MNKVILFTVVQIFSTASLCLGQPPSITFASSFYKTTAGAIGPHGIVATTTYELTIASQKTIILDRAVIAGITVQGEGIIIPTNKEATISFRILITTLQKDSVWYNGELEFEGVRVALPVARAPVFNQLDDLPVVLLYLRSSKTDYVIAKEQFDMEQTQYNK